MYAGRWTTVLPHTRVRALPGWLLNSFAVLEYRLQVSTIAYAESILRGALHATEEQIQHRLYTRLIRQTLFERGDSTPVYLAVIDEAVLRRSIGGVAVMREQLLHLRSMMDRSRVMIQIIPAGAGNTTGMTGGFAIAELPGGQRWAYLDGAISSQVTEHAEDVSVVSVMHDALRAWALPQQWSGDLVERLRAVIHLRHESRWFGQVLWVVAQAESRSSACVMARVSLQ